MNQTYHSAFRYLNITPDRKEIRLEKLKENMQYKSTKMNKIETNFISKNIRNAGSKKMMNETMPSKQSGNLGITISSQRFNQTRAKSREGFQKDI